MTNRLTLMGETITDGQKIDDGQHCAVGASFSRSRALKGRDRKLENDG